MNLQWSKDRNQNHNLKAINERAKGDSVTLVTVTYNKDDKCWRVCPKLPGTKPEVVKNVEEGKIKALGICRIWFTKVGAIPTTFV